MVLFCKAVYLTTFGHNYKNTPPGRSHQCTKGLANLQNKQFAADPDPSRETINVKYRMKPMKYSHFALKYSLTAEIQNIVQFALHPLHSKWEY